MFSVFFLKYVLCSVTCTVGHNCVFLVLFILFDPVLHAPLETIVFNFFCTFCFMQSYMHRWSGLCFPWFCTYCLMQCYIPRWTPWCFSCFFVNMFYVVLPAPLGTIVFSVFFLYILFDAVFHAPLGTLTFFVFFTHCLMHCYMHRWTHWCFHYFIHIAWSSVTCSVGHNGVFPIFVHTVWSSVSCAVGHNVVFRVLFILFYAVLDTLAFSLFCTYCFM